MSAVPYDKLCLCLGARPKKIAEHPRIIGLRDQLSVEDLLQRLRTASRLAVVGNGGIALELIHEVRSAALFHFL
jgi:pyruvate/2-oxoglutarate dehydrogenase complex dihydrolipoamide dehydrogenase (E3) component